MLNYHRIPEHDKAINQAYNEAVRNINRDIEVIFKNLVKRTGLTREEIETEMAKPADPVVIRSFKEKLLSVTDEATRRHIERTLNIAASQGRISRLQAVEASIKLELQKAAETEIAANKIVFDGVVRDAYYKTIYDLQKGTGLGFSFNALPKKTVNEILRNQWSKRSWSSRVWANVDMLAESIPKRFMASFLSGINPVDLVREFKSQTKAKTEAEAIYNARRLVHTEITYVANMAEMESYKECEIERYMFVATLDLRTSLICQEHDGEDYAVEDAVPGENLPPLHPWCRSTTIILLDGDVLNRMERRARDPATGKLIKVPGDMKYKEWYDTYVKGDDQAELARKKLKNLQADKQQFKKYRAVLGNAAPKGFEKFQDLKYNESNEWKVTQQNKRQMINQLKYSQRLNGMLSNSEVRKWYVEQTKKIASQIDSSKPLAEQAQQAFEFRNRYKEQARLMMTDRVSAGRLNQEEALKSFEELIAEKMRRKNMTREQAYEDILKSAGVTRRSVNEKYDID